MEDATKTRETLLSGPYGADNGSRLGPLLRKGSGGFVRMGCKDFPCPRPDD